MVRICKRVQEQARARLRFYMLFSYDLEPSNAAARAGMKCVCHVVSCLVICWSSFVADRQMAIEVVDGGSAFSGVGCVCLLWSEGRAFSLA